eukprot:GHVU01059184.1.p3 GENE.GHVU01059184.1~~GHVU01059184.1.p3  ORF type:complete len:107 (+),score=10.58 GHVU01059184.1:525-845(+)
MKACFAVFYFLHLVETMTSDAFRILVEVGKRPIIQTVMQSLQAAPPRICFTVRCWHLERSQASGAEHLSYERDFACRTTSDVPSFACNAEMKYHSWPSTDAYEPST